MHSSTVQLAQKASHPLARFIARKSGLMTIGALLFFASITMFSATAEAGDCYSTPGPKVYYGANHHRQSHAVPYGHFRVTVGTASCGPRYQHNYRDHQYSNGYNEGIRHGYSQGHSDGYRGRRACNTEPNWVRYKPAPYREGFHQSFHNSYNRGYSTGAHERRHRGHCHTPPPRYRRHCH